MNKLIIIVGLFLLSCNAYAMMIGTYLLPPYSMYEDGANLGLATEIVEKILHDAGFDQNTIIRYPIARGLAELQADRIDVFYPYIKSSNPVDENYILLGPIASYDLGLFVSTNFKEQISLKNLQQQIIAVESGSIVESMLNINSLYIEHVTQQVNCLKMVLADRATACALGFLPGIYIATMNDFLPKLRYTKITQHVDMYILLRKNLPENDLKKITASFKVLQKQGFFAKKQREYENKFKLFEKSMS